MVRGREDGRQLGVAAAEVNYATGRAHVVLSDPDTDLQVLHAAVAKIGYQLRDPEHEATEDGDEEARAERSWLRRVLIGWPLAPALVGLPCPVVERARPSSRPLEMARWRPRRGRRGPPCSGPCRS